MDQKRFYITTTLPYMNAGPHIGFTLELIQADALARYHRLLGEEVFFNCGTDEHGQKIWEKAQEAKKNPQEFVDFFSEKFYALKEQLNVSWDAFIRTTDSKHKEAAQFLWKICQKKGDIYKKKHRGKYCIGCELEKTDSELEHGLCPLHPNQKPQETEEENYFFAFSKYEKELSQLWEKDFLVPDHRLNELRELIKNHGLKDFSISRLKKKMPWGIDVPDDPDHVMYVWFDALTNYISTLGWPKNQESFEKFWTGEKNCLQVAGKDQVRPQAGMWQAMLLSAGLPTTGQIFIHGFITSGGQKMSKSLGNVLDPLEIVEKYGADALRYFLLRHIHPTEDSDLTLKGFHEVYMANLVNGLGNLASRILKMSSDAKVRLSFEPQIKRENLPLQNFDFHMAMDKIWEQISDCDRFIAEEKPYKKITENPAGGKEDLLYLLEKLYEIALSLEAFMPHTTEKILAAIARNEKPEQALFPRLEFKTK